MGNIAMPSVRLISFLFLFSNCIPLLAVEFGVYGGVALNHNELSNQTSYNLDALDLFASQEVGKKTEAFIELVFEDSSTGVVADVERFWVSYALHKNVKLGAGRFHTSVGFWNHNYHHGGFLQDTISRPFFLDFEDGNIAIMPVHSIGLKSNIRVKALKGIINFDFLTGNGSSLNDAGEILIYNSEPEHNIKTSISSRLSYTNATQFEMGLSFLRNQFTAANAFGANLASDFIYSQNVFALDFKLDLKLFYILTELFSLSIRDEKTDLSENSTAAYFQLGLRLIDNLTFTLRHSILESENNDPFYNLVLQNNNDGEISYQTFTTRYNLNESNSLKLELQRADVATIYSLQWAFLLF